MTDLARAARRKRWWGLGLLAAVLNTACAQVASPILVTPAPVASVAGQQPWLFGRVSELAAAVQQWDAERRIWIPAAINMPITSGDRIRVESGSHAVLEVGSLQVVAAAGSELELPAIEPQRVQIRLLRGSMAVRTASWPMLQWLELGTEDVRVQPLGLGVLRLDKPSARQSVTRITAFQAGVRILHPQPAADVAPGTRVDVVWADGAPDWRAQPVAVDAFHQVLAGIRAPAAGEGVAVAPAPEITGWSELDRHGRWEQHPDLGAVWWPIRVAPDWEPYRNGRWVWVRPGQWVWWEDAVWGFAPFHHGSWLRWRDRWVWSPHLNPPRPGWRGDPRPPGWSSRVPQPVSPPPAPPPALAVPGAPDARQPWPPIRGEPPAWRDPSFGPPGHRPRDPGPRLRGDGLPEAPRDASRDMPRARPPETAREGVRDKPSPAPRHAHPDAVRDPVRERREREQER